MLGIKPKLVLLLTLVVVAMVAVTAALTGQVADKISVNTEEQLKSSNEVVRLAASVEGYSVLHEALEAARTPGIVSGLACPTTPEALAAARRVSAPTIDENGVSTPGQAQTTCTATQHETVLRTLTAWNAGRQEARANNELRYLSERDLGFAIPRQPELLIVADAAGVVVARVGFDKDDWYGESKPNMSNAFGVVARTELGEPQFDYVVWRESESASPQLVRMGAAPVLDESGTYVGSVVVGYMLSDTAADEAVQALYNIDVAYFFRGEGNQVSFAGSTLSTNPQFADAMTQVEYTREGEAVSFAELALQHEGKVYGFAHGGAEHMAMSTSLSTDDAGTAVQAGFLVTTSASIPVAPLQRISKVVPLLGLALLILGILAILVAVKQFMFPVEEVSKGVQEVIAGNREYMWDVDERSHLSDLAHSLNIMSARLQGKRDPDAEDGDGDADWAAMAGGGGGAAPAAKPAGVAGLGGLRGRVDDDDDDDDE